MREASTDGELLAGTTLPDPFTEDAGRAFIERQWHRVERGEGLSLATLEGDGQVVIQSMTYDGLASAIAKRIGGDDRRGLTGGLLGGGND